MSILFDVHTHQRDKQSGVYRIEQLTLHDKPSQNPFSISIHPWDINKGYEIKKLMEYAQHPNCIAIGETGLDKLAEDFPLQQEVFIEHIKVANAVKKPLIVHCVKAYDICMALLKQTQFSHGVLFHGFNKHPHLAEQIIKKGFYISLGVFFLKENPNFERFLMKTNFKGVLFETDNHNTLHVDQLYKKAKDIHPSLDIVNTLTENFNNWKEK